jgi:CheY-like chemotaxis protein
LNAQVEQKENVMRPFLSPTPRHGPAGDDKMSQKPSHVIEPHRPGGLDRPHVLLVDDSAVVRSLLGEMLRRDGFTVCVAAGGRQALDIYRQHRDEIDLVVLDQRMPGLDGLQTLDGLRCLNPDVRCCFLTGAHEDDAELLRRGAACVLHKPMEPDDIALALRQMVT